MHAVSILHTQLALELFQGITLIKILVAVFMVVVLSLVAEFVSPRFAGILSGYPLGAAISLFFMGFEISPDFAAHSAVYTLVGLIATQTFCYCYYLGSYFSRRVSKWLNISLAVAAGLAGYFLTAALLHCWRIDLAAAVLLPCVSIFLFMGLFRRIPNVKIQKRVRINFGILMLRALVAALFIVLITATAQMVGTRWAGLFAAFPVTLLPLTLLIHITYDVEHVDVILKNVPKGIGSLIVYALAVSQLYPHFGVAVGTLLAYLAATLYLGIIQMHRQVPMRIPFLQQRLPDRKNSP